MKAKIGIVAAINSEHSSSVLRDYVNAIEKVDVLPVIIPYVEKEENLNELFDLCDGIMLLGGEDVMPSLYGEEKKPTCGENCRERDDYEMLIFEKALYSFKPILAICRGSQLVNVALGGTLHQDIPSEIENALDHKKSTEMPSYTHKINVIDGTPLHALINSDEMQINTFHHQCIKDLGRLLEVMAVADDGIIEAYYMPSYRFLRAYQWHPERMVDTDENCLNIFKEFADECQKGEVSDADL